MAVTPLLNDLNFSHQQAIMELQRKAWKIVATAQWKL